MASIMDRIRMIVRSEASDFVERHEDAEKVINQTIADAMVTYASLRRELEPLVESETQARDRLDTLTNEAERWHNVARKALLAGNEADARTALSREQTTKERIAAQRDIYQQMHEITNKMRAKVAEIEDGINQLQAQSARIKAKEAAAKATSAAGEMSSGLSELDRKEQDADWQLAQAEGQAEAQRILEDPFAELERASKMQQATPATVPASSVDDALAALKAQVAAEE